MEQGSSALAKDLALGLKRGRVDLSVLVDNVDGRASSIGKIDDLLGAHVPPHLDAFGLELGGVDWFHLTSCQTQWRVSHILHYRLSSLLLSSNWLHLDD